MNAVASALVALLLGFLDAALASASPAWSSATCGDCQRKLRLVRGMPCLCVQGVQVSALGCRLTTVLRSAKALVCREQT